MTESVAKCDITGTGDIVFPGCFRRLSAREAAALAVLAGLGLAGNYYSVPLFFGVDFLFGSIAALIAVRLCGGVWGVPVAAVAASFTLVLWGHPYAIIIFAAEALVVGMVCCRFKSENLILADAGFWVFLGMPMVWALYTYFLDMDPTAVKLIMLKQGINGIVNAVAANILFHLLPFKRWTGDRRSETRISLQQLLFNVLSAFIVLPMLTSTIIANREELEDIKSAIVDNLNEDLADLDSDLESWHTQHAAMLRFGVLEALQIDAGSTTGRLERLAKSIPGLLGVQYTAEDGRIIAAYPEHDDRGLPYVGQISTYSRYLAQASSGVFTVSDIHEDPWQHAAHFSSVVPFATANEESGFIVASFTPEHMAEFLAREASDGARQITILDGERRVVSSINTGDKPMDNFTLDRQGKFVRLDGSQYHWLPANNGSKVPEMVRWRRSSFVAEAPLGNTTKWSIVVGIPMAPYVDRLREDYARKLLLVIVISVLGLVLVPIVSRRLSAPLERLTSITDRIVERGDLAARSDWPNSSVREISTLSASFRAMMDTTLATAVENRRIADDLTQLIETANAPIFCVDAEGLITEWNQAAADITGLHKEDVLGGHILEQFVEEERSGLKEIMHSVYVGHRVVSHEIDVWTIAGRRVQVLLNATPRRDAAGNVTGVVGIGQDISERRRVEAELIQAAKLATLGEMATGMAHELNQPLNVIRMAADSSIEHIEDGALDAARLREKLARISAQTERAATIIDHMQIFGRKVDTERELFDLRETVDNALMFFRQQLKLRDIDIVTSVSGSCPSILGHKVQIEQVLLNLIANARDAIEANGHGDDGGRRIDLIVECDDAEGRVKLVVRDSGGGIPGEALPRVFEPFFTTKEVGKGTGLGLSVSYGIVSDMGGTLSATNVEGGAQFTVSLPAAA